MKFKWLLGIGAISLALVLLVARPMPNLFVPDDMLGQWVTSSPKYQDRYIELSRVSVVFGTGGDSIAVNFVTAVQEQVENGKSLTIIEYQNTQGESGRLCFYWSPADNGEIRLKNREDMVWRRISKAL